VDCRTVKEQLLYEVHDPAAYLTPDVVADITQATVAQVGPDRVRLSGVKGHPRTTTLKALAFFDGGWLGEAEISYAGPNAEARARLAMDMMQKRLGGDMPLRCDLIGVTSLFADDAGEAIARHPRGHATDVRLRVASRHEDGAAHRPPAARGDRAVDRRPRRRRRRAHRQAPAPVQPRLPGAARADPRQLADRLRSRRAGHRSLRPGPRPHGRQGQHRSTSA
jgi:hypothetical protein